MTIKKYQGKTKDEAIALAKKELGADAEIMNVEEKKSGGFLGLGRKVLFEITAMVDRDDDSSLLSASVSPDANKKKVNSTSEASGGRFEAVADQPIKMSYEKNNNNDLEETKKQFAKLSEIFRENEKNNIDASSREASDNNEARDNNVSSVNRDNEAVGTTSEAAAYTPNNESVPSEYELASHNHKFVRTLYNTLLDGDIDERYINDLLADMEKVLKNANNVNFLISNVYQKMILKLGQPKTIKMAKKGPKVVFFIGSTGVGKTTTIAKLASEYKMTQKKQVALITIDTYRLKATDQLGEYASIMKIPMNVIYEPDELTDKVDKLHKYDLILVDTSGFSHKNNEMRDNVIRLVNDLDDRYEKEVYLVLSSTTKYSDLKEIIDSYKEFTDFNMIFTKLDETTSLGNIYNCKLYSNKSLSYVTNGQNVPKDIGLLDTQRLVKQLLGGN